MKLGGRWPPCTLYHGPCTPLAAGASQRSVRRLLFLRAAVCGPRPEARARTAYPVPCTLPSLGAVGGPRPEARARPLYPVPCTLPSSGAVGGPRPEAEQTDAWHDVAVEECQLPLYPVPCTQLLLTHMAPAAQPAATVGRALGRAVELGPS